MGAAVPASRAPSGSEVRFCAALARLAQAGKLGCAYADGARLVWASAPPPPQAVRVPLDSPAGSAALLWGPPAGAALAQALRELAAAAADCQQAEADLEQALDQLNQSWENLEVLYDVGAALRCFPGERRVLEEIVRRAAGQDARAALWVGGSAGLEIAAAHPAGAVPAAIPALASQAVARQRTLLDRSGAVAATITAGRGTPGALALWREDAHGRFDSVRIRLVEALALECGVVVEGERLHRLEVDNARALKEMEIAARVQDTLLHGVVPAHLAGLDAGALSLPAQLVGGDLYDFICHRPDCLDVVIGDVMGKGVATALLAAALKDRLLRGLLRLVSAADREPPPEAIVDQLHQHLAGELARMESFVTLAYARFDLRLRRLRYVDCGHTRALAWKAPAGRVESFWGSNVPLGFRDREVYEASCLPLDAGDVFLFYSDGVTESRDPGGECFGEARLASCLDQLHHLPAADLVREVRRSVARHAAAEAFADDFTCVAVRVTA